MITVLLILHLMIAASLVGAVGGLLYVRIAGKDASTYELPFGSFLGVAALSVAVYSEIFQRLHPR